MALASSGKLSSTRAPSVAVVVVDVAHRYYYLWFVRQNRVVPSRFEERFDKDILL